MMKWLLVWTIQERKKTWLGVNGPNWAVEEYKMQLLYIYNNWSEWNMTVAYMIHLNGFSKLLAGNIMHNNWGTVPSQLLQTNRA